VWPGLLEYNQAAGYFECSPPKLTAPLCLTSTLLESTQQAVTRQGCPWSRHLRTPSTSANSALPTCRETLPSPALLEHLGFQGKSPPAHVHREFEAYLKCGRLEHGFLGVRCDKCHFERLVVFSCKKRGFCPSCGARRMAGTAALLSDEVFPDVPLRQWVISFPFPLRYLFAAHPHAMANAMRTSCRHITVPLRCWRPLRPSLRPLMRATQ
jgi:ribosomal protein S27E